MDKENRSFRIILPLRNSAGVDGQIIEMPDPNVDNVLKSMSKMFTITVLPVRG